jgi:hypothetical protein
VRDVVIAVILITSMGVDKFFKTLARLASSSQFSVRKQLAQNIERFSEKEKILTRLASGFLLLLAKPEFYSDLASW